MRNPLLLSLLAWLAAVPAQADELLFQDDFKGKLGEGWSWVREDRQAWRVSERGLEIRVQPGNMWGPSNNAKNVLVHPAPDPVKGEIEVSVIVENKPTEQYEQVDLVWYYDDSHMVKIGQEMVDGRLSLVMGREEKDRTRTLAIIPIEGASVQLRFLVKGDQLRGQFRAATSEQWREAGACSLPAQGPPKISFQAYQGPAQAEHWARFSQFHIRRLSDR